MHPFMWFGVYVAGDALRIPAAPEPRSASGMRTADASLRYRMEVVGSYRATARSPPFQDLQIFHNKNCLILHGVEPSAEKCGMIELPIPCGGFCAKSARLPPKGAVL